MTLILTLRRGLSCWEPPATWLVSVWHPCLCLPGSDLTSTTLLASFLWYLVGIPLWEPELVTPWPQTFQYPNTFTWSRMHGSCPAYVKTRGIWCLCWRVSDHLEFLFNNKNILCFSHWDAGLIYFLKMVILNTGFIGFQTKITHSVSRERWLSDGDSQVHSYNQNRDSAGMQWQGWTLLG